MAEKDWISKYFAPLTPDGLTDDVAPLSAPGPMIVTQDAMLEGRHFFEDDPFDTIARKLVRVNVSDIIAKGARPHEALLTLGWPEEAPEDLLRLFAGAFGQELKAWGIALIGGDTITSYDGLLLSLTLTGQCIGAQPVRRSGAEIGDDIWVTGEIGWGFEGYEAHHREAKRSRARRYYQVPEIPPLGLADIIAVHANASIDISDGLLGDAKAVGDASGVLMHLNYEHIPFANGKTGEDLRWKYATWGDDYQALFTAPSQNRDDIAKKCAEIGVKLARIGAVEAGKGLKVTENGQTVNLPETLGFEHGGVMSR